MRNVLKSANGVPGSAFLQLFFSLLRLQTNLQRRTGGTPPGGKGRFEGNSFHLDALRAVRYA